MAFSNFESYSRGSFPHGLIERPEILYDLCVDASVSGLGLSYHYNEKNVSAVAPLWDNGSDSDGGQPILKYVVAGSFKPVKEEEEDDEYVRVCAEQNFIDNGLVIGDTLLGAMFVRMSKRADPFEGNKETEAPHFCKPCRDRAFPIFGGGLVVVSFIGDGIVPIEATTIQQQKDHHDYGKPLKVLASGLEVREFVIEEVFKTDRHSKTVTELPKLPKRLYRRKPAFV